MQVEDFLSLQATVAWPGDRDSDEEIGELQELCPCHPPILTFSLLEEYLEFIEDDEILDNSPIVSRPGGLFFEDDESSDDFKRITADINARHSRSHTQHNPSDDQSIKQPDAQIYSFFVPVSDACSVEYSNFNLSAGF